jgi:hypothetical protein
MFDSLLSIDKSLVAWIIHTSPADADDGQQEQSMQLVLVARGDVEQSLNSLIAYRLRLAAAELAADAKTLQGIATKLDAIDAAIAEVQTVLALAGQAVQIADKAVAFFAE